MMAPFGISGNIGIADFEFYMDRTCFIERSKTKNGWLINAF